MGLRHRLPVIGTPVDVLDWSQALSQIRAWAEARDSRYVCVCNVHSVVTAHRDPGFARVLREADMATPDGAPVAWLMRRLGAVDQPRINGPDLMWRFCERLSQDAGGVSAPSVYLYGGTEETLAVLQERLLAQFPGLRIAGAFAPPFRELTEAEDAGIVDAINASGAGLVWVALGCPKQETWMAAHRGRIRAVMVGVGAAFDYHAGRIRRAPVWMQRNGLEWLYRLCMEPGRLWRRYLVTNTLFTLYASRQLVAVRNGRADRP